MKELRYQQRAVAELVRRTIGLLNHSGSRRTLSFQAPTGSGKTVMVSEMLMRLDREIKEAPDAPFTQLAYIWIAPNKLHEQSYFKMKNYFTENCALRPVVFDELDHAAASYIKPGEILFLNWESINKDNNRVTRESEQMASLFEITRRTQYEQGIPIVIIIDEEHRMASSSAKKAEKVLNKISAKLEIRVSATPEPGRQYNDRYEVPREDVIEEEMIKEKIELNPALDFKEAHGSLNQHLVWLALQKRQELAAAYRALGVDINPLLLIQLPNDDNNLTHDDLKVRDEVTASLDAYGINTDNGKLAIWLSEEKTDNLTKLEQLNNPVEVLLFKQAVALGWDCPRAAVLLIFRKMGSFQFTAQTVGRILRMPEQKYYSDSRLNQAYVYTNLAADMIKILQADMDYFPKIANAKIRKGIQNITLDSVYRDRLAIDRNRLGPDFRDVLKGVFMTEWGLCPGKAAFFSDDDIIIHKSGGDNPAPIPDDETDGAKNQASLNRRTAIDRHGINFNVENICTDIVRDLDMTGEVGEIIVRSKAQYINNVADLTAAFLALCKRLLGNDYEQRSVRTLAGAIKEVMEELFELYESDTMKVVLSDEDPHHNRSKFERLIYKAILTYSEILRRRQAEAKSRALKHGPWEVPAERTYPLESHTERAEIQYHALLSYYEYTGPKPSGHEHDFAKFLDKNSDAIEWWYKNGDQGRAHYAIEYTDSLGEKAPFYVDFIIRMKSGDIFLFDTKTKQLDAQAPYKHNGLLEYIQRPENQEKHLHGGIITKDKFGNWVYPAKPLDPARGTSDTTDWVIFDPQNYI